MTLGLPDLRASRRSASTLQALLLAAVISVTLMTAGHAARWGRNYIPNVAVIDQHGKQLNFYDDLIQKKIVVISFIYTTCKDICPLVTARLAQTQEALGDLVGRDIFFLSISVDPKRDTPERLKAYAEAFGAGPGWSFITGRIEDIRLIRDKLGERSRSLGEHRNEILIGNDSTGEWAHDSAFGDLKVLAMTIRNMDPRRRQLAAQQVRLDTASVVPESSIAPGQALFVKACAACHTIGRGRRVGPDLKHIAGRRQPDWLTRYIAAPATMRASGDATALALSKEFNSVRMPTLGLSDNDVGDVLKYIELESARVNSAADYQLRREPVAQERQTTGHQH